MEKELICIVCPNGCRLTVKDGEVTGNKCVRGVEYAISETTNPVRTVTSTCKVISRLPFNKLVSVKTSKPIPKGKIMDVMAEINKVTVTAPCHIGDVVIKDVLGLGADIVVTKEVI